MGRTLTWEEILARTDLIGGDIESLESGIVYRGPLAEIKDIDGHIHFISPWCARLNPSTAEWESWEVTTANVGKEILPQDAGDGRVFFSMPFLGVCTIFPKGGSRLDPRKVKGLPKASRRFLALYPDLRFDPEIADKILVEKAFHRTREVFREMPGNGTLQDLLACFRNDDSAEEFLWSYVEEVLGEKEPHNQVY